MLRFIPLSTLFYFSGLGFTISYVIIKRNIYCVKMKHTKNKSSSNTSNLPSTTSPSKGKGDKGKGKGAGDGNGSGINKLGNKDRDRRESIGIGTDKELRGDSIDLKDCPLRLPEFADADHAKLVPRYTSGNRLDSILSLIIKVLIH